MSTMLLPLNRLAMAGCLLLAPQLLCAQNAFSPGGNDYPIAGALAGDQTFPHVSISTNGGYAVWQDNGVDGAGLGIRAERIDSLFNKTGIQFRVNSIATDDQEKPQVGLLKDGGAVFVWQGGKQGFQKIYARFLPATGTTFRSADIRVNSYTNNFQVNPSVAVLKDGSVVVVWGSYGQDGSMQGIYGRRFTAAGVTNGAEFRISQFTANNQRTPCVAPLAGGGFVVAWVSELQRNAASVDVYARIFNASGVPVGDEFAVNADATRACANPSVTGSPDGGFAVAWSRRDVQGANSAYSQFSTTAVVPSSGSGWDVFARTFDPAGAPLSAEFPLNTRLFGDQFAPRLAIFGRSYLAVWSGLGQDGSREGVFGQFFSRSGERAGVEFRVNTAPGSRQIHPMACSDGANRFLVVWSSFATSGTFDLFARSYDLIRIDIAPINGGFRISWNSRPGAVYQVQSSANYTTWTNHGSPRTAAAYADSVDVTSGASSTVYRVVRVQ